MAIANAHRHPPATILLRPHPHPLEDTAAPTYTLLGAKPFEPPLLRREMGRGQSLPVAYEHRTPHDALVATTPIATMPILPIPGQDSSDLNLLKTAAAYRQQPYDRLNQGKDGYAIKARIEEEQYFKT